MQYKDAKKPLPQIARELNVDAIMEGSVLRSGNKVRVTAQLIQASPEQHLWAKSYESDLRDVLSLQSQVAQSVANQIRIKLTERGSSAAAETSSSRRSRGARCLSARSILLEQRRSRKT